MLKRFVLTMGLIALSILFVAAQRQKSNTEFKENSVEDYINQYSKVATSNMRQYGIPASIILAQGILESNYGNSKLARVANNHFGIKCHDWTGAKYYMDDDEKDECFRAYRNVSESFADHAEFLKGRSRYAGLFELDPKDYKSWAKGLQRAGYATNPNYANLLIRIIEERNLHKYDTGNPDFQGFESPDDMLKELDNRVFVFNDVKVVISMPGQKLSDIGDKYNVRLKKMLKYNELETDQELYKGSRVYLQPKKKKSFVRKYHIVEETETMYSISQLEGIKLEHLYKKNLMEPGQEPVTGTRLCLRKKCPTTPNLKTKEDLERLQKLRLKRGLDQPGYESVPVATEEQEEPATTTTKDKEPEKEAPKEELSFEEELERQMNQSKNPPVTLVDSSYNMGKTIEPKEEKVITPTTEELPNENTLTKEPPVEKEVAEVKEAEEDLPPPNVKMHTVAKGETLYAISKKYGVSISQLKDWNNLTSSSLSTGEVIVVSITGGETAKEEPTPEPIKEEVVKTEPKEAPAAKGTYKIHVVQPQETLYGLSKEYGVTIAQIKEWNNLSGNSIEKGMELIVGKGEESTPPVKESAPPKEEMKVHTVQRGETLYAISKMYGVTVEQISNWNSLSGTSLEPGQKLNIGAGSVTPPPAPKGPQYKTHKVQAKETLYSISKKYGVAISELKEWNQLESYDLTVGQELIVGKE